MQPRTLDSIISELNTTYNPQIDAVRRRQAELPGQVQAEEQGLQAKQTQAFDDILQGARRRGTGVAFGGIPLGEQAKYSATEYMPALARLRQSARENALSLEDTINSIYEKRNTFANQIKQNEDQLFESRRQFDANMAFQKEQEAARLREASRAAAASSAFSPSFGGIGGGTPAPAGGKAAAPAVNKYQQQAYNDVYTRVSRDKDAALRSDFVATAESAKRGNPVDLAKLQIYRSLRPDLFKAVYSFEGPIRR